VSLSSCHRASLRRLHSRPWRAKGRIPTLDIQRANFDLFWDLLGGISRAGVLEGKGACENGTTFKKHFFQAQDRCIPKSRKSGKGGRRPAWMSKEFVDKSKGRRRSMKCGKRACPLGRSIGGACREQTRLKLTWSCSSPRR